ncbi:hypothetical protein SCLCIDRAFT_1212175 [Scleroderma citrinum Foug A]|uniref:Uncharacterized protein n=1 Tax=Scleroderma citrinum Foug A TaxID=1036808 RepID=A0A0C3EBV1_9AGAM|nr:hypothetical protein SCLCIDRAFT_1212175 [Scleroderma citrinum Foug A]
MENYFLGAVKKWFQNHGAPRCPSEWHGLSHEAHKELRFEWWEPSLSETVSKDRGNVLKLMTRARLVESIRLVTQLSRDTILQQINFCERMAPGRLSKFLLALPLRNSEQRASDSDEASSESQ